MSQVATSPQTFTIAAASSVNYFDPSYTSSNITLSSGNAIATRGAAADNWVSTLSVTRKTTGKWYFEVLVGTLSGKDMIGFGDPLMNLSSYAGSDGHGFGWHSSAGAYYYKGAAFATGIGTYAAGDVLMFAADADAGMLWLGKNGTWNGAGNPGAGTAAAFTGASGSLLPSPIGASASLFHSGNVATLRVKGSEFSYTSPAGFSSLSGT